MNNLIEERSSSFFDDFKDPGDMSSSQSYQGNKEEDFPVEELSLYAVDVDNIEELVKQEKVA